MSTVLEEQPLALYQRTFSCNQVSSQLFFLTKVLITFESVTVDLFMNFP